MKPDFNEMGIEYIYWDKLEADSIQSLKDLTIKTLVVIGSKEYIGGLEEIFM